VIAKRGDRVAPPPRPGGFAVRFDNNDAAKGWEDLCRQAPANTRAAFEAIEADPCPVASTKRQHRLKLRPSSALHGGQPLPQWQYEVTCGGRIWYLVDVETQTCWIKYAGTAHPNDTE
jgi:hypothetical protein